MAPRSRRRHEILRVAQTLQALPHSDFMKGLTAATEAQLVLAVDGLGPSPSTTEIAATLQCAGWLVAAARGSTHPVAVRSARIAVGRCLYAARIALHEVPMDRDLLCAVMQPGPGSMVPGIATWLPWAVQLLLEHTAGIGAGPLSPDASPLWEAELVAYVWSVLLQASVKYMPDSTSDLSTSTTTTNSSSSSSSKLTLHPATLLTQPLVQLAHQVLKVMVVPPHAEPSRSRFIDLLLCQTMCAGAAAGSLSAHPALYEAVKGRPGDVALGTAAAEALRQDIWWHILATCSKALTGKELFWAPKSSHPCELNPLPRMYGYPAQHTEDWCLVKLSVCRSEALHVLLLSELWDLWAWQLQLLQDASSAATDPQAEPSSSSSSRGHGGGGDSSSSLSTGAGVCSSSSSSSSSSIGNVQHGCSSQELSDSGPMDAGTQCDSSSNSDWCGHAYLNFPLLPQCVGTPAHGAAPGSAVGVTLQQLQLVTRSLNQGLVGSAVSGVLLMSLLLQRADPGLRAQFLGSPMGSYYLDGLVTLALRGQATGAPSRLVWTPPSDAPGTVLADLKSVLQEQTPNGGLWQLPAATGSLLALVWAHVQVQQGAQLQANPIAVPLLGAVLGAQTTDGERWVKHNSGLQEYLVVCPMPAEAFRFLPGLTPSLELFAAVEKLLRAHQAHPAHLPVALQAVCVLLEHAVDVWVPVEVIINSGHIDSSSSSSSSSSQVRGAGAVDRDTFGDSTATSCSSATELTAAADPSDQAGSNSSGSSTPGAAAGPGVLQALSSLAVSIASCVHIAKNIKSGPNEWGALASSSSVIAATMVCLAAHQLQQPGADRLGALGLAAAGQRLAAVSAEAVDQALVPLLGMPAGDAAMDSDGRGSCSNSGRGSCRGNNCQDSSQTTFVAGQNGMQQQQQQQDAAQTGIDDSSRDDASLFLNVFRALDGCLCTMQGALQVLDIMSMMALGGNAGSGPMAFTATTASQAANTPTTEDAEGVADTAAAGYIQVCDASVDELMLILLQSARQLQQRCRPRVQLVGCSNRGCTNLSGPSAEGLVAGRKGVRCGGCGVARYCCPACQQEDWPKHRHVCRRLAGAAVQGQGQG